MNKKDIDFTKISIPADDFDEMMRQALGVAPAEDRAAASDGQPTKWPRSQKNKKASG